MSTALTAPDVFAHVARGSNGLPEHKTDLRRLVAEAKNLQARIAAKEDLLWLWGNRMLGALKRNETFATNQWVLGKRTDDQYVEALQEILGPSFKVVRDCSRSFFSLEYVEISWE